MATVETAVALSAFVVVLMLAIGSIVAVCDQVRCTDAAREAARLIARGERDRGAEAVRRIGPAGATLRVRSTADQIVVQVRAEPLGGVLPGVHLAGTAYAIAEPTGPPA
jgi:Flp pilus assembly protein TadG